MRIGAHSTDASLYVQVNHTFAAPPVTPDVALGAMCHPAVLLRFHTVAAKRLFQQI